MARNQKRSVTKTMRFEVFKRDGFTCQYCGRTPPDAVLEADHINPKSKGGDCGINNLITACFDCNRGKRDHELDRIPTPLADNITVLKERELQISEYNKLLEGIKRRENRYINRVAKIYADRFDGWELTKQFKETSLRRFIKLLPITEVEEAMHAACARIKSDHYAIKYFCGICWRKIKGEEKK